MTTAAKRAKKKANKAKKEPLAARVDETLAPVVKESEHAAAMAALAATKKFAKKLGS